MSRIQLGRDGRAPRAEVEPRDAARATPLHLGPFSLEVGRAFGTVVVSVRGNLDLAGCDLLDATLAALIEDQSNATVGVDLGKATAEPERAAVLVVAACRARYRGTRFILLEPPPEIDKILRLIEWRDLMDILPRRAFHG